MIWLAPSFGLLQVVSLAKRFTDSISGSNYDYRVKQCVSVSVCNCVFHNLDWIGRAIDCNTRILHKNINAVCTIELINHIIFKYLNYKSISNDSLKVAWLDGEPKS